MQLYTPIHTTLVLQYWQVFFLPESGVPGFALDKPGSDLQRFIMIIMIIKMLSVSHKNVGRLVSKLMKKIRMNSIPYDTESEL